MSEYWPKSKARALVVWPKITRKMTESEID